MRYVYSAWQNHPPGCLTYNRNIVLSADNPVPGWTRYAIRQKAQHSTSVDTLYILCVASHKFFKWIKQH